MQRQDLGPPSWDDDAEELNMEEDYYRARGRGRSESFVNELEDEEVRMKEKELMEKVEQGARMGTNNGAGSSAGMNKQGSRRTGYRANGMSSYDSIEDFEPVVKTQLSQKTLDIVTNLEHTKYNKRTIPHSDVELFPQPVVDMSQEEAEEEIALEEEAKAASVAPPKDKKKETRRSGSGVGTKVGKLGIGKVKTSGGGSKSKSPGSAPNSASSASTSERVGSPPPPGPNSSLNLDRHASTSPSDSSAVVGELDGVQSPVSAGSSPISGTAVVLAEGNTDQPISIATEKDLHAASGSSSSPKSGEGGPCISQIEREGGDSTTARESESRALKQKQTSSSAGDLTILSGSGSLVGTNVATNKQPQGLRARAFVKMTSSLRSLKKLSPYSMRKSSSRLSSEVYRTGNDGIGGDSAVSGPVGASDGADHLALADDVLSEVNAKLHHSEDLGHDNFDYHIKVLLLGDSAVGKTSLMMRFSENEFTQNLMSTAGVDFKVRFLEDAVKTKGKRIKCQIWDTAGQERFHVITRTYYRGSHAIALVYDVCNEQSFEQISYWMNNIKSHAGPEVFVVLFGNKIDLPQRKISFEQGKAVAEKYNCLFFETSAKDGTNVLEAFEALSMNAVTRIDASKQRKELDSNPSNTARNKPDGRSRNSGCSIL